MKGTTRYLFMKVHQAPSFYVLKLKCDPVLGWAVLAALENAEKEQMLLLLFFIMCGDKRCLRLES